MKTALEKAYLHSLSQCRDARVVILGAGLGLSIAKHLVQSARKNGCPVQEGEIVILDAGGLDLLAHLRNSDLPRIHRMKYGLNGIGGRTRFWGCATPRPPERRLREWPYPLEVLDQRFHHHEREMGVHDPIPFSGRKLDQNLALRLSTDLEDVSTVVGIRLAPVAINGHGHCWSSLDDLPETLAAGVRIVPHAKCTTLQASRNAIQSLRGVWQNKRRFELRPEVLILAVGVHPTLRLLRPVLPADIPFAPADHFRIDLHGSVPLSRSLAAEELGIAVQNLECRAENSDVAYHLEVKAAPAGLWKHLPSGDNLRSDDPHILVQIQAIAEMHSRLRVSTLVRDPRSIHTQIEGRDVQFHAEIARQMSRIGQAMGLSEPHQFCMRPLLKNHHLYGLLRIGRGLRPDLSIDGLENCFVAAPAGFVDIDDDANPLLRSRVLNSFLCEAIVEKCWPRVVSAPAESAFAS